MRFFLAVILAIVMAAFFWLTFQPKDTAILNEINPNQLAELKTGSKLTLINLWASWCEPCKAEFPALLKMREKYESKGFRLVLISVDLGSALKDAESFLKSHSVGFKTFWANGTVDQLAPQLSVQWQGAVPSSFMFDSKGQLVDFWEGEVKPDALDSKLSRFL